MADAGVGHRQQPHRRPQLAPPRRAARPAARCIAIRHWDGYWFGTDRPWGDVFPHYWGALTATTLLWMRAQERAE
ncbi:hypothetical protein EJ357_41500 [Streptomyces cyaneochromogenes]|uniref:Uncharacterized protein n=1 Tax=Streptomyces cyaneochromogenes TaxID=2496836 RepID=A0A3Q9EZS5_9ACTN|nr:hypothetical protein EJ357_41500 [Streptomyces cyaneochromogenes]